MIKRALRKTLRRLGYDLVPANSVYSHVGNDSFTMEAALKRCVKRDLKVSTVIDVGASNGMWSELCLSAFPDADYLLIEAQEPHKQALEEFAARHPKARIVMAAAGSREGSIYFDNGDLFGGVASEKPLEKDCIEVRVTTIDLEIKKHNLKPPFLIKLDTHGFEVPILEGASDALKNSSLLIIEEYNYRLTDTSLLYFEMGQYLGEKEFLSVDMVDLMIRQKDNTLWQMDVFYEPAGSRYFQSNSYA